MRSMKLGVPKAPGQKRYNAGSAYGACGADWRAGQQLAWLTAKIEPLEWHVEVDFGTEVSLLEGHVASSRLIWLRRCRFSKCSVFVLALCCRIRKYAALTCSWRARVKIKRQRPSPVLMRRPVWGGPQAAGKRHSQPFRAKRLPHPRVVCRPTKPVAGLK